MIASKRRDENKLKQKGRATGVTMGVFGRMPMTRFPPATRSLPAVALLCLAIAGCGDRGASDAAPPRAAVRVIAAPLAFEHAVTRVEAVGTSRALRSIELHPAASGEVVAVNFEPGQRVSKGDLLVELDSRAERLAVDLARVRLEDAQRLYDRYERTGGSGAVLPTEIDAAATQVEAARIELDRARVAYDDRFIRAPFDGFVDYTEVDPGDRINPDSLITILDDRSTLLVSFEVPEFMVGELAIGDTVELTPWSKSAALLAGAVVEVGSRIDAATRTFTARATVDNRTDALRPGMSFRVSVNVEGREYAVVAETAVQWGAEGAYVWLIQDDIATRRQVRIVQRQQGRALVEGDLRSGDLLVVEGIQRMRDGVAVEFDLVAGVGNRTESGEALD